MPEAAVKETSAYKILQLQYSVAYQGEGWRGGSVRWEECEGGGNVRVGSVRVGECERGSVRVGSVRVGGV